MPAAGSEKPSLNLNEFAGQVVSQEKASRGTKLFHQAVTDGNIDQVKLPLSKGVAVNVKDERGQTPLHFAARKGRTTMIDLLISKSVDISLLNTTSQRKLA